MVVCETTMTRSPPTKIRAVPGISAENTGLPETRQTAIQLGHAMTTTESRQQLSDSLSAKAETATWGATSPATGTGSHRRSSPAAKARTSTTTPAASTSTRCRACSSCRPDTAAPNFRRSRRQTGRDAGLLPAVELRHTVGNRTGRTTFDLHAGRPEPRCSSPPVAAGGRRERVEAGQAVLQDHRQTGQKYKVLSRSIAYHGTPQGALAITGIPAFKAPFDPPTPAVSACRI